MANSAMKKALLFVTVALQFLTRLPIPATVPFNSVTVAGSVMFFPFAGAVIGLLVGAAGLQLQPWLPAMPLAVLLLGIWIALSGGLHLDGWMDTADGVLSHRSRERMLEIMKDSRVGAMGVSAAVLLLLMKFSLLSVLLEGTFSGVTAAHFVVICIWSRWWMSAAIAGWPNARSGEGLGALFKDVRALHSVAAAALGFALSLGGYLAAGVAFVQSLEYALGFPILAVAAGWLFAAWLNRKLGGLTGDTYGAMNEAVEAVLLMALVIWR